MLHSTLSAYCASTVPLSTLYSHCLLCLNLPPLLTLPTPLTAHSHSHCSLYLDSYYTSCCSLTHLLAAPHSLTCCSSLTYLLLTHTRLVACSYTTRSYSLFTYAVIRRLSKGTVSVVDSKGISWTRIWCGEYIL